MERSCIKVQQKIKLIYITSNTEIVGKDLRFLYAFYFFYFYFWDLFSYFFLFQNIYFSNNAPLINNLFINSIIEKILQFLISNLLFSLQEYCLDLSADFTKIPTYFHNVLIIAL